ncbi:MAG TPA: DUF3048 domain-containing protein [Acidimicrobiales bacterium]|nr:DUF3048 domain-containing protein [Acidimicrobiales bacterium]
MAFGVVVALTTTACSDGGGSGAAGGLPLPGVDAVTTTSIAAVPSPLTGLAIPRALAQRPVVTVKVDNSPAARPQAGLAAADLIYEERVEGSVVRFLAVYQSTDAAPVGPVRSVRSTDAAIIAPLGGVFAFSGGIATFTERARTTGVRLVTEDDNAGVKARPGRKRPLATYADTERLRLASRTGAPPPLFARLAPPETFAPTAREASALKVVFGSLTTAEWKWDAAQNVWLRSTNGTPHLLEGGHRVDATCVILQTVPYKATKESDRSGFQVDEAVITGSGRAIVGCEGRTIAARWDKPSLKAVTTWSDAETGRPIRLTPGRTWVSLVPTTAAVTVTPKVPRVTTTAPGKLGRS